MKNKLKKVYRQLIDVIKEEILLELKDRSILNNADIDNDLDRPMSAVELADYFGIHPSTVNRYIMKGLRVQSKSKNCKRFFTKRDFNEFITKRNKRNGQN